MKKLPWHNICFLVLLALAGTVGLRNTINATNTSLTYTNSIAAFLLFSFWLFGLWQLTTDKGWANTKSLLPPCFIFMLCFAGSMAAGVQLDQTHNVDFFNVRLYLSVFFVALAAAPILAAIIRKLEKYSIQGVSACSQHRLHIAKNTIPPPLYHL